MPECAQPRILDAAVAHPAPAPGPALDAILAHNEQTLPVRTIPPWLTGASSKARSATRATACVTTSAASATGWRDEAAAARDQAARAEARVAELEALLKARDEDSSPG